MRLRRTKPSTGTLPRSRRLLNTITVFSTPGNPRRGTLRCGPLLFPCALGRGGVTHLKREGDGATPAGRHRLTLLYVRANRQLGPRTTLPVRNTRCTDGWCDDPTSGQYNRPLRLPSRLSHEEIWREDRLYDIVGVLDWNVMPRISRAGSAIFLHLCRADFSATAGCVALRPGDLKRLLAAVGRRPEMLVKAKPRKVRPAGKLAALRH